MALEVLVGIPLAPVLLDAIGGSATIVMSTHARSAFGELLIGSVTDEVVRRSAVPVVLVGPHVERPTGAYQEIVACVDDDERMNHLVGLLASAAVDLHLHPWIFQVLPPPQAAVETQLVHHAADLLRSLGVTADWDVGHGTDPARAIVDFTRSLPAPLVAVSAHGRNPAQRFRESSVSVAVARQARCPVLVLGPSYSPARVDARRLSA